MQEDLLLATGRPKLQACQRKLPGPTALRSVFAALHYILYTPRRLLGTCYQWTASLPACWYALCITCCPSNYTVHIHSTTPCPTYSGSCTINVCRVVCSHASLQQDQPLCMLAIAVTPQICRELQLQLSMLPQQLLLPVR